MNAFGVPAAIDCVFSLLVCRAMLDALISKRFMRAAVLTEGCTLWCLTKADLPADTTYAATCVTQLAISYLITKSTGTQCVCFPTILV